MKWEQGCYTFMILIVRGWSLPLTLSCMLVVKVSELGAGMLHISS